MMLKTPNEAAQRTESRIGPLWTLGCIIFWAIIALVALAGVTPARAQFVANDSFDANGTPKLAVELQPWLDVSLGYAAQKLTRDTPTLPDGSNRAVDILLYGPCAAVGLWF